MNSTFEYRIKCRACGLHYSVYSWAQDWAQDNKDGFCPECGVKGSKIVWGPVETAKEIHELVPGKAEILSLT